MIFRSNFCRLDTNLYHFSTDQDPDLTLIRIRLQYRYSKLKRIRIQDVAPIQIQKSYSAPAENGTYLIALFMYLNRIHPIAKGLAN